MPLMFIVFGKMTDDFVAGGSYGNCFKYPSIEDNITSFNDFYFPPCDAGQARVHQRTYGVRGFVPL
jgi:hypothetical protein